MELWPVLLEWWSCGLIVHCLEVVLFEGLIAVVGYLEGASI